LGVVRRGGGHGEPPRLADEVADEAADEVADEMADEVVDEVADEVADVGCRPCFGREVAVSALAAFGHLVVEGIRQAKGQETEKGQKVPGRAQFGGEAEDGAAFHPELTAIRDYQAIAFAGQTKAFIIKRL
jgi:hypothetical protein